MIRLSHPTSFLQGEISLPSSKSISNRMLLLQSLYEPTLQIDNISEANDSQILKGILASPAQTVDVQDAGAVFRFMVAYCACSPGTWNISGTARLNQRPISELVDALRLFGADITYLEKEGEAPLLVRGKELKASQEVVDVSQVRSSQFVSALLMIAPKVKGEFSLKINIGMYSFSYVLLTVSCMRRMGFSVHIKGSYIQVSKHQKFDGEYFLVEPDWTSFYYWFSMIHLSESADLFFPGLRLNNIQKERKLLFKVGSVTVKMEEVNDGLRFIKEGKAEIDCPEELNFSQYPDSAMTYAILIGAVGCTPTYFKGLESLKYKESEREAGIISHLEKMNVTFTPEGERWQLDNKNFHLKADTIFPTYDDHRMAMCIAPLALLKSVVIEQPYTVKKSYPRFWNDLSSLGFEIDELHD